MKIDFLETPSEDVRIEIIPLIDVIFCILTFFILAAVGLTRQQAIDLDLPNASTGNALPPQGLGTAAALRQRLYVSVDAIGAVYVDQEVVSVAQLYDILQQHQVRSPEGLIVLYASREARYEDVIQVLDLLRSVGGDRVALATLPGESPAVPGGATDPSLFDLSPSLDDPLFTPDPSLDDSFLNPSDIPSEPLPGSPGETVVPGSPGTIPSDPGTSESPQTAPAEEGGPEED
ncbi:MAG: biopolymer transporter ExbD [Cyanobacteria bacterium J06626_18]